MHQPPIAVTVVYLMECRICALKGLDAFKQHEGKYNF